MGGKVSKRVRHRVVVPLTRYAREVLETSLWCSLHTVTGVLSDPDLPLPGEGHLVVHHHGQPGGEVGDGGVDEMLTGVAPTDRWYSSTVCHPASHLHVVRPADPTDVRVGQHEVLQVEPDLTDVVVHRLDHQAADRGEGGGTGEERPVLRSLGVALTGEGAAGSKASSTGPSSLPSSPATLRGCVADTVMTWDTVQSHLQLY